MVKIFKEALQISNASTGEGQDRICYVQPDDAIKVIKLHKDARNKQTRRELAFYRNRAWRKNTDYSQLPRFYGKVKTSLGDGFWLPVTVTRTPVIGWLTGTLSSCQPRNPQKDAENILSGVRTIRGFRGHKFHHQSN